MDQFRSNKDSGIMGASTNIFNEYRTGGGYPYMNFNTNQIGHVFNVVPSYGSIKNTSQRSTNVKNTTSTNVNNTTSTNVKNTTSTNVKNATSTNVKNANDGQISKGINVLNKSFNQIKQLTRSLSNVTTNLDNKKKECNDLMIDIAEKNVNIGVLNDEISNLNKRIVDLMNDKHRCESEKNALQIRIDELLARIDGYNTQEEVSNEIQEEIGRLRRVIEDLKGIEENLTNQLNDAQNQLENAQNQVESNERTIAELHKRINELEGDINSKDRELQSKSDWISPNVHEQQMNRWEKTLTNTHQSIHNTAIQHYNTKLADIEKEHQNALAEVTSERNAAINEIEIITANTVGKIDEITKECHDKIEKITKECDDDINQLQATLANTQSGLTATQAELATTQATLTNTQSGLTDAQAELANTQATLANTQSGLTAAQTELATTRTGLTAAQAELATTRTGLTAAQTELANTQARLEIKEAEIISLTEVLTQSKTELEKCRESSDEMSDMEVTLNEELDNLKKELNQLKEDNENRDKTIADYENIMREHVLQKEEMNNEINKFKAELDTRKDQLNKLIAIEGSNIGEMNNDNINEIIRQRNEELEKCKELESIIEEYSKEINDKDSIINNLENELRTLRTMMNEMNNEKIERGKPIHIAVLQIDDIPAFKQITKPPKINKWEPLFSMWDEKEVQNIFNQITEKMIEYHKNVHMISPENESYIKQYAYAMYQQTYKTDVSKILNTFIKDTNISLIVNKSTIANNMRDYMYSKRRDNIDYYMAAHLGIAVDNTQSGGNSESINTFEMVNNVLEKLKSCNNMIYQMEDEQERLHNQLDTCTQELGEIEQELNINPNNKLEQAAENKLEEIRKIKQEMKQIIENGESLEIEINTLKETLKNKDKSINELETNKNEITNALNEANEMISQLCDGLDKENDTCLNAIQTLKQNRDRDPERLELYRYVTDILKKLVTINANVPNVNSQYSSSQYVHALSTVLSEQIELLSNNQIPVDIRNEVPELKEQLKILQKRIYELEQAESKVKTLTDTINANSVKSIELHDKYKILMNKYKELLSTFPGVNLDNYVTKEDGIMDSLNVLTNKQLPEPIDSSVIVDVMKNIQDTTKNAYDLLNGTAMRSLFGNGNGNDNRNGNENGNGIVTGGAITMQSLREQLNELKEVISSLRVKMGKHIQGQIKIEKVLDMEYDTMSNAANAIITELEMCRNSPKNNLVSTERIAELETQLREITDKLSNTTTQLKEAESQIDTFRIQSQRTQQIGEQAIGCSNKLAECEMKIRNLETKLSNCTSLVSTIISLRLKMNTIVKITRKINEFFNKNNSSFQSRLDKASKYMKTSYVEDGHEEILCVHRERDCPQCKCRDIEWYSQLESTIIDVNNTLESIVNNTSNVLSNMGIDSLNSVDDFMNMALDATMEEQNAIIFDNPEFCAILTDIKSTIDTNLGSKLRMLKSIINDWEGYSGAVRVYVRINPYQGKKPNCDLITNPIYHDMINDYGIEYDDKFMCPTIVKDQLWIADSGMVCPSIDIFQRSPPAEIVRRNGRDIRRYGPFYGVYEYVTNEQMFCGNSSFVRNGNTPILTCSPGSVPGNREYDTEKIDPKDDNEIGIENPGLISAIDQLYDGYSVAIFGYGYSGAGKTYSLFGDLSSGSTTYGLLQLALANLTGVSEVSLVFAKDIYGIMNKEMFGRGRDGIFFSKGDAFNTYDYHAEYDSLINSVTKNGLLEWDDNNSTVFTESLNGMLREIDRFRRTPREFNGNSISLINATPNNFDSSRAHLSLTFRVVFKNGNVGHLTVIDMAGIEDPFDIGGLFLPKYQLSYDNQYNRSSISVKTNKQQLVGPNYEEYFEYYSMKESEFLAYCEYRKSKRDTSVPANGVKYTLDEEETMHRYAYNLLRNDINSGKQNANRITLFEGDFKRRIEHNYDMNYNKIDRTFTWATDENSYEHNKMGDTLDVVFNTYYLNYAAPESYTRNGRIQKDKRDSNMEKWNKFINKMFDPEHMKVIFLEAFYINETLNNMKYFFANKDSNPKNYPRGYQKYHIGDEYSPNMYIYDPARTLHLVRHSDKPLPNDLKVDRYDSRNMYTKMNDPVGISTHLNTLETDDFRPLNRPNEVFDVAPVTPAYKLNIGDTSLGVYGKYTYQVVGENQYKEWERTDAPIQTFKPKPTKFIMLVLVRPETGLDIKNDKFCAGAKASLEFAQAIKST